MEVFIPAIIQLVTAIAAAVSAYFAWKAKQTIEVVHVNTNSMKDSLVAATAKISFKEGKEEEEKNPGSTKTA